jgi:hypothetical protein
MCFRCTVCCYHDNEIFAESSNELLGDMDQKKNGCYAPLFTKLPHKKICELLAEGHTEESDIKVREAGCKIIRFLTKYRAGSARVQLIYSVPDEFGLLYFLPRRRGPSRKFCVQFKVYLHKGVYAISNKSLDSELLSARIRVGGYELRAKYNIFAANGLGGRAPVFALEYNALYIPVTSSKKYSKLPPCTIEGAIKPTDKELQDIKEACKNYEELMKPRRECSFPGCARRGFAKHFKVCNSCKVGCYCDTTCQQNDWPHHASVCKTDLMKKSLI